MRISRVQIQNFRNFARVDVKFGKNAVIVGENKIGKSNFLYALRLVLDPSLPDSARKLRNEDFWDGLTRPLDENTRIIISVDLTDFENDENQLAVLAEHLIEPEPMVARLTYAWQPLAGLENNPSKDSDYEFVVYGGDRPENTISYELRRRLPMELMPALRDCEGDLARWSRSPLRPLLDNAASEIDHDELLELGAGVDDATQAVTELDQVKSVADSIGDKLTEMVGSSQTLETVLRFSPTDPEKLIRALRIFIDGGQRGISDASLGSANLLYFALKNLEYDQLIEEGDRDHTFLAIEEPEAHLHPSLQRLVFRNYLKSRDGADPTDPSRRATILMTTHSPHIASVTPLKDFVLLRQNKNADSTEAVSAAEIDLEDNDIADLERYLDVNRGEMFFARGIVLVEGDAEKFLLPVLARNQGIYLDELGISVCSISGTNFYPYLLLLGPFGLTIPVSALTDFDPRKPKKKDGTPRDPLGPDRVVNHMMPAILSDDEWDELELDEFHLNELDDYLDMSMDRGIFLNSHTLEVDLFRAGLGEEFVTAMKSIDQGKEKLKTKRMQAWAADLDNLDVDRFLADIDAVGKGRFAQRLASVILETKTKACPEYILKGIQYVVDKCQ